MEANKLFQTLEINDRPRIKTPNPSDSEDCIIGDDSNHSGYSNDSDNSDKSTKLLGYKKHLEKELKEKPDMFQPALGGMEEFKARVESGKIEKGYLIFVARDMFEEINLERPETRRVWTKKKNEKLESRYLGALGLLTTSFVESNVNQKYIFAHVAIYVGKWEDKHYFVENGGPFTGKELLTGENAKKYDTAIRLIEAKEVISSQPFIATTIPFGRIGEYHDGYRMRKRRIYPGQEELVQKALASVGFPLNYHLRRSSSDIFAMVLIGIGENDDKDMFPLLESNAELGKHYIGSSDITEIDRGEVEEFRERFKSWLDYQDTADGIDTSAFKVKGGAVVIEELLLLDEPEKRDEGTCDEDMDEATCETHIQTSTDKAIYGGPAKLKEDCKEGVSKNIENEAAKQPDDVPIKRGRGRPKPSTKTKRDNLVNLEVVSTPAKRGRRASTTQIKRPDKAMYGGPTKLKEDCKEGVSKNIENEAAKQPDDVPIKRGRGRPKSSTKTKQDNLVNLEAVSPPAKRGRRASTTQIKRPDKAIYGGPAKLKEDCKEGVSRRRLKRVCGRAKSSTKTKQDNLVNLEAVSPSASTTKIKRPDKAMYGGPAKLKEDCKEGVSRRRLKQNTQIKRPGGKSSEVLPGGWEEYHDPNGRAYYYNHNTRTTQWGHPGGVEGEERVQEDEIPGHTDCPDIDGLHPIIKEFHNLMALIYKTKLRNISNEEIDIMIKNWNSILINLIPFESLKLINLIETLSFHIASKPSEIDRVLLMLKIFSSYARMKLISIEEVNAVLHSFGIHILHEASKEINSDLNTEAVFKILFPGTDMFFQDDISTQTFCKNTKEEIMTALGSPAVLRWIKEKLKEDEDILNLEDQSLFEHFPLDKIDINVNYTYPGSTNCIVQVKFREFPQHPNETNALIKIISTVLRKIKVISKVGIDTHTETDNRTLRLKIDVNFGKFSFKTKQKIETFVNEFVDNVRKGIINSKDEMVRLLQTDGNLSPPSIGQLVSKVLEPDEFYIKIVPEQELPVETVRLKNVPVWPLETRQLSELPHNDMIEIINIFRNNFHNDLCLDVIQNLDVFQEENNYGKITGALSTLNVFISPYNRIIQDYSELGGTIGGVISAMDSCLQNERIKRDMEKEGKNPVEVINDIVNQLNSLKEARFKEWLDKISAIYSLENRCIANFEDFKKAAMKKSTMAALKDNVRTWNEIVPNVEEGDQIWMWRHNYKVKYAHVGVYVGDGDMIHVSQEGLYGIIKKEEAVDVINNSKCFIVRPDATRQAAMSGTPKDRAFACLELKFLYSVTEGSCEVFVNCITQGIWTSDLATLQGREHRHVDNTITAANALFKFKSRKKQKQDLLNQLAKCLLSKQFNDRDKIQHARAIAEGFNENVEPDFGERMENVIMASDTMEFQPSQSLQPGPSNARQ